MLIYVPGFKSMLIYYRLLIKNVCPYVVRAHIILAEKATMKKNV